jgi:hypothetical protein
VQAFWAFLCFFLALKYSLLCRFCQELSASLFCSVGSKYTKIATIKLGQGIATMVQNNIDLRFWFH